MLRAVLVLAAAVAAPAAAQQLDPAALAKLKAATVFIKVTTGPQRSSGSGFVVAKDGAAAIVVTNAHVVDPAFREAMEEEVPAGRGEMPPPVLDVYFDSGSNTERKGRAVILASDIPRDLAVLKVTGGGAVPDPLDLADPPKLLETMPVFVCGFPFGAQLAAGTKNPEISIGPASISSIRKDDAGRIAQVQLNGALNPGNSGGPVVSAAGKLVGVAVTTVKGAGIGFAVPRDEVAAMLGGRLGGARLIPKVVGGDDGVPCTLELELHDPLGKIKSVTAHYKPVENRPPANQMPIGNKLLPGLTKLPLAVDGRLATADVTLPAGQRGLLVQIEIEYATGPLFTDPGLVTPSVPQATPGNRTAMPAVKLPGGQLLPYPLAFIPTDDDTLSKVNRKPDEYVGKSITIDALSNCTVDDRNGHYELSVLTDADREPSNLRVLVPKDLGLQLSDLGVPERRTFAVRVAGKLEKPKGKDAKFVLAADEVSFLDAEGKPAGTLKPEAVPPAGEPTLTAVNRFPETFVGRTLTVKAVVKSGVRYAGQGLGLDVWNENGAKPLNLDAYMSKSLAAQVESELTTDLAAATVTLKVERVDAKTGHGIVGVSKIESVVAGKAKTLAGDGAIQYPPVSVAPKPVEKAAAKATEPVVKAPEPAKPAGTNYALMIGVGAGAVTVLALLVTLFIVVKKRTAAAVVKSKYGRKPEPDAEPESEWVEQPKYGKKPQPPARGPAPPQDEFPGFG